MISSVLSPSILEPFFSKPCHRESVTREINTFLSKQKNVEVACSRSIGTYRQNGRRAHFYLRKDEETGMVSLIYPTLPLVEVGSGAFKKYVESVTLNLPLPGCECEPELFDSVLMRGHTKSDFQQIKDGVTVHTWLFNKEKPGDVYLADPLTPLAHRRFTMVRYQASGDSVYFDSQKMVHSLLRDMTKAVLWVQAQKVFHQDVKWGNFLVDTRVDHEGVVRPIAFLADIDRIKKAGAPRRKARSSYNFDYWDPCRRFGGIVTPFIGYYALTFCRLLKLGRSPETLVEIRDKIYVQAALGIEVVPERHFWVPFRLSPFEEKTRVLFIQICEESAKVCLKLKKIKGLISEERVERALARTKASQIKDELISLADDYCKEF